LSVAVAVPVFAGAVDAPQANCLSAGQVITGAVLSINVMFCTQVAVLLQASVASQVRFTPAWPVQLAAIGASLKVITGVPPQLSVAVADPVFAGAVDAPQANCLSAGQVITGAVLSINVMFCTQVAVLLQASVACHVRFTPA